MSIRVRGLHLVRGVFFLFVAYIFVGDESIHPDQRSDASRIAAAERVEEFSSLDLSRCAWAAAMLEDLQVPKGCPKDDQSLEILERMAMAMARRLVVKSPKISLPHK